MTKQQKKDRNAEQIIIDYVLANGSITNRECRRLIDSSYDDTIKLLGALTLSGKLVRVGSSSATKYVMGDERDG